MSNLLQQYQQVGASDNALGVSASTGPVAKDGVALQNSDLVLGGVNLGGANTGTITINGGAGVEKVAEQFTETLNSLTGADDETKAAETEAKAADSASWRKTIAYVAVGLGLILLSFLFRKKS